MFIAFPNPQGNFDPHDSYWAQHPDSGGQLVYVKEKRSVGVVVDVVTFGELLIDFVSTELGVSLIEAPAFQKAAGGAPANVAVGLARLGVSSGFMGKVGDDDFGHFLARTLAENGVDTSALLFSDEARTALAFVSLTTDGERGFMFYRHPSADMLIRPEEIDHDYIGLANAFHYGSISLIGEPSRSASVEPTWRRLSASPTLSVHCDHHPARGHPSPAHPERR